MGRRYRCSSRRLHLQSSCESSCQGAWTNLPEQCSYLPIEAFGYLRCCLWMYSAKTLTNRLISRRVVKKTRIVIFFRRKCYEFNVKVDRHWWIVFFMEAAMRDTVWLALKNSSRLFILKKRLFYWWIFIIIIQ